MHTPHPTSQVGPALLLLACGAGGLACSSEGADRRLRVGTEAPGGGDEGGAGVAGSAPDRDGGVTSSWQALSVHVEDIEQMTIEVITLGCAGDCADVEAVASGGNPPYAFAWDDGSTRAKRRVCLDADAMLTVSATDTALDDDEFHYDAHTASAELSAQVLDCADGSVPDGGGAPVSVYWTTWTAMTTGAPGSGEGTLSPPGGDVSVDYSGEAAAGSAVTGQPSVSGLATVTFAPASTYLSATVGPAPPETGMVGVQGSAQLTQTVTFSEPVRDPLLAVVSLGNFGVPTTWTFDTAPTAVLSSGPGVFNQNGTLTASGTALTGAEGNGVVQFTGTFSALSFNVTAPVGGMDFAAFTVGIRGRP